MSKSKYRSPSTDQPCTGAQLVAEVMCQRRATREKIGALGYKFWNDPKWKKIYIRQVADANKLVKEFGEETLVKFIFSSFAKSIYSLGLKNIRSKIEFFKKQLDKTQNYDIITETELSTDDYSARPTFSKNNMAKKLRRIE